MFLRTLEQKQSDYHGKAWANWLEDESIWRDPVILAVTGEAIINKPALANTVASYKCMSKPS